MLNGETIRLDGALRMPPKLARANVGTLRRIKEHERFQLVSPPTLRESIQCQKR